MNKTEYLYYVWLTQINGIGPVIGKKLLSIFKSPRVVYNLSFEEISRVEGIGYETAKKIAKARDLNTSEHIINNCINKGIKITVLDDDIYPEILRKYNNIPLVLYYRGNLFKKLTGVSIVGSRRCTDYSKRVTVEASEFLAQCGTAVISGMAKGIDSYAHTACIKAGGFTVAVLGCSVDIAYPNEHKELMKKIIETGVVLSEYPPGTPPKADYFPKRNMIISALSTKVLVTEAGEKSGALITAEYALKQGKELYAVPGGIYCKEFKGCNKLISNGAKIFLDKNQLINTELKLFNAAKDNNSILKHGNNYLEEAVISALSCGTLSIDEISSRLNINRGELINLLFSMEIDNKVKLIGGKVFL